MHVLSHKSQIYLKMDFQAVEFWMKNPRVNIRMHRVFLTIDIIDSLS